MPRRVLGGLIQAAAPLTDPAAPYDSVRAAAIDAHIPLVLRASVPPWLVGATHDR